jgi:guanine nucleotide-binding protein alpha-1 subunit
MRLSPLQQVEEALLRRLTPAGSPEWEATRLAPVTNLPDPNLLSPANGGAGRGRAEIAINSNAPWKNAFNKLMAGTNRASFDSQNIDFDDPQDPGYILSVCAEDMIKLWNDETIRTLLRAKKIRLQEKSGL